MENPPLGATMATVRPAAIIFLITLGGMVLVAVIGHLARREPVDESRESPFPYASPGRYVYGALLATFTLVAAGVGRVAIVGGRVVARTWHRRQDAPESSL